MTWGRLSRGLAFPGGGGRKLLLPHPANIQVVIEPPQHPLSRQLQLTLVPLELCVPTP